MNDNELLERHRAGSHEAFEELVRRHINWVYCVARRRVRDAHLAEDVTQTSFTTLFRKAPRLKGGQTLSLWLFTVVNRAALDALRSETRRRRRETEAVRMQGDLTTSETSEWAEFEPYLDEMVGGLDADDRQAVLLRYYEQKPFSEVGAALGVSEEAARKRVSRATDRLRVLLESRGMRMSAVALTGVLFSQATQAAPIGMVTSMAAHAAMAAKMTLMGKGVAAISSGPGKIITVSLIVVWLMLAVMIARFNADDESVTNTAVAHIAVAEYVPIPGWQARFNRVYRLQPGEVLKNLQHPHIPERAVYMTNVIRTDAQSRMSELWPGAGFQWDPISRQRLRGGGWMGYYSRSLFSLLRSFGVESYELQGSDEWLKRTIDGDWIFNVQATVPQRLDALSNILRDTFGRKVRFEKSLTEQRVIVAGGKYQFKPMPGARTLDRRDWLHIYVKTFDPKLTIVDDFKTLPEFFKQISSNLRIRFVDESDKTAQLRPLTVTWHRTATPFVDMPASQERDRGIESILESIAAQTGLVFAQEKRQYEIWQIIDDGSGENHR